MGIGVIPKVGAWDDNEKCGAVDLWWKDQDGMRYSLCYLFNEDENIYARGYLNNIKMRGDMEWCMLA